MGDDCFTVKGLKYFISNAGYKVCYYYKTPRLANVLPRLWYSSHDGFGYFEVDGTGRGKFTPLQRKEKWRYLPPYDPYLACADEFVLLMLLTPARRLDERRIKIDRYPHGTNTIASVLGKDFKALSSEAIMKKLGVENVFSNRVFYANEGCMFQVDCEIPELDWRGLGTRAEYEQLLKHRRNQNSTVIHLSPDEASEIVHLAYAVNGDEKGHVAAYARHPKILRPVSQAKTGIGRRIQEALTKATCRQTGE